MSEAERYRGMLQVALGEACTERSEGGVPIGAAKFDGDGKLPATRTAAIGVAFCQGRCRGGCVQDRSVLSLRLTEDGELTLIDARRFFNGKRQPLLAVERVKRIF